MARKAKKEVDITQWNESDAAMSALIKRAQDGDVSVLPELRKMFDAHPRMTNEFNSLERFTLTRIAKSISGNNLETREVTYRQAEMRVAEVAGTNPTPLELLLARRVAICELHLNMAELHSWAEYGKTISLEKSAFNQKRIERAQRMFTQAIKSLAVVRRLQIPAMQVNIGDQQINTLKMVAERGQKAIDHSVSDK